MPKNIQKSLQGYISKIKKQAPHLQISHSSLSATTSKIISGCKHPKSLSFAVNRWRSHKDRVDHEYQSDESAAATLEDIDRFLVENFKSLYGKDRRRSIDSDFEVTLVDDASKEKDKGKEKCFLNESESSGALYDSQRFFTPPPDLCGSHRFFISPASSGSLLDEASMLSSGAGTPNTPDDIGFSSASMVDARAHNRDKEKNNPSPIPEGVEDCIAVLTVSPSPYEDFRRSMQEMLDARVHHNQRVDWDFMEELLFCYLRLNEKKQYKFILSAFVDLVVVLRQNSSNGAPDNGSGFPDDNNDVNGKKIGDY